MPNNHGAILIWHQFTPDMIKMFEKKENRDERK